MNDYDNVVFLSAGIEGRNDGPRTMEEAVYCQKLAKGRVGKWTNLEKERFALVDGEGNDEELFGRADRRCGIGGVGSEEPETFLILLGRRRQRERERWKVIAARFALFFLFFQDCGKFLWICLDGQGYVVLCCTASR